MINVTCKVKNESDRGSREIEVRSVERIVGEPFGQVELKVDSAIIRVYGDDLIQAVENCLSNGRRRFNAYRSIDQAYVREEE